MSSEDRSRIIKLLEQLVNEDINRAELGMDDAKKSVKAALADLKSGDILRQALISKESLLNIESRGKHYSARRGLLLSALDFLAALKEGAQ